MSGVVRKKIKQSVSLIATFLFLTGFLGATPARGATPAQGATPAGSTISNGDRLLAGRPVPLPLYFIQNNGQIDPKVRFYEKGSGHAISFTEEGVYLTLETETIRLFPVGAKANLKPFAEEPQPGRVNYFIGNDPKAWRTNIPTHRSVIYKEVYPGIDMKFYGNNRELEYDIIVKPGANTQTIRLGYEGIEALKVNRAGALEVVLKKGGSLFHKMPIIYQEINGKRIEVKGQFKLYKDFILAGNATQTYGFDIASYNKNYPLIIDPIFVYSSYLGGNQDDIGYGIAADSAGNAYVSGYTSSSNFATSTGALQKNISGKKDLFITKIDTTAATSSSLIYSTYLGGAEDDVGNGIAIDSSGNAYVTGYTSSSNFPTTVPPMTPSNIGTKQNLFITKIGASGATLVYSVYLGGSENDIGYGIAIDSSGNAYVTGSTFSSDFPVTANTAFQKTIAETNSTDAFITKIDVSGSSLLYSTYLGGGDINTSGDDDYDEGSGIAVDSAGNAYVTGVTSSAKFPITASTFQTVNAGPLGTSDAFIAKIDTMATGSASLVYSTYLGGAKDDYGYGIAVDSGGFAYITGGTLSSDFKVASSFQGALRGGADDTDLFVTKINATGSNLVYSTYLGGIDSDEGRGIAVDSAGNAYVTGRTFSNDFPTLSSPQKESAGRSDLFITKINPAGSALLYSTYLGGSSSDEGNAIAIGRDGDADIAAYVTGQTLSTDLFTVSPFQAGFAGPPQSQLTQSQSSGDAFIAKITTKPAPVKPGEPTEPAEDTISPNVKSVTPADKTTAVSVSTLIRATFSEDINPSMTLNPDALTVTDSNDLPVQGTVTYDVPSKTATFTPKTDLALSTTYTIAITSGVQDLAGNRLATSTSTFDTNPASPPPPADKKKGCFIATAAYGSYLDPHVMVLRVFRDRYLMTHRPGRIFVDLYYRYSPPVADYIRGHHAVKMAVRGFLTPIIYAIAYPGIFVLAALISISALAVLLGRKRKVVALADHGSSNNNPPC